MQTELQFTKLFTTTLGSVWYFSWTTYSEGQELSVWQFCFLRGVGSELRRWCLDLNGSRAPKALGWGFSGAGDGVGYV